MRCLFVTALFAGLFSGGSEAALGPIIQKVQATAYSRDDVSSVLRLYLRTRPLTGLWDFPLS